MPITAVMRVYSKLCHAPMMFNSINVRVNATGL
ncbi:unnamed protein product [Dibothriocephalus latus]|uniref:Uncharacterized protein n=1 Tax=Dibothriocephalus latus TaxID=60516 RepID=A0A3P7MEW5_DIBLA|nr:unnamed protein product [Dibothriocephalus latus]